MKKKRYWRDILWFALGTLFGGFVLGFLKGILGGVTGGKL